MTTSQIHLARSLQTIALILCAFWFYKQNGLEPIVVGLLVLAGFLVPLASNKDALIPSGKSEPNVLPVEVVEPASGVTPDSVWSAIDSAPPFQKNDVAGQYVGIKVKWSLILFSAERAQGDLVDLVLTGDKSLKHAVSCTVDISHYRELAVLHRGAPITVCGEIARVRDLVIRLSAVTLSFG